MQLPSSGGHLVLADQLYFILIVVSSEDFDNELFLGFVS